MTAIAIFAAGALYIAVAAFATWIAVRAVRRSGRGPLSQWSIGTVVSLVFALVLFWDWLPTIVAHEYYCAREGSFTIRKSLEQWKLENKESLRELLYNRDAKIVSVGGYRRFPLNQRLASERKGPIPVFLSIRRVEGRIVDMANGEVLVDYVDFVAGHGASSEEAWKFWLPVRRCDDEGRGRSNFALIEQAIQKLVRFPSS